MKNKVNIFLIVLIIIFIVLIVLELSTKVVSLGFSNLKHSIYRIIGKESKEGNTIGNINNYGYITEDDEYLYYMCPSKNGKYVGISKVKKDDLTGKQIRLIEGNYEIASINSYGDYIYFVTFSKDSNNSEDNQEVDNKIHRVNKNGNKKDEILNDNDFHDGAYKITVVDNKIYYIGTDECIWYMDLNGNHKTRLNENASGYEIVTEKYIIYNMSKDGEKISSTYIMDRSGKNAREINGERLFTPIIYKDEIFYLTEDRYLHKMDLNGKNDTMLSDSKIYNLNVSEDGIFYLNYIYSEDKQNIEGLAVYRMDFDGKNNKKIYTLQSTSNTLCLVKNWVFFLDSNDNQGLMEMISPDGKEKIDLFVLNYSDYYYMDELIKEKENSEQEAVQENNSNEE